LPYQPLPFPGNVQDREVTRAKRGAFDRETALLVIREPVGFHFSLPFLSLKTQNLWKERSAGISPVRVDVLRLVKHQKRTIGNPMSEQAVFTLGEGREGRSQE
jgi:hypothetical protein